MTRDNSQFFPMGLSDADANPSRLWRLGWKPFFSQQTTLEDMEATPPVRVIEVRRNGLHVIGENIDTRMPPIPDIAVGDWLLFDADNPKESRVLERTGLFQRRAPGAGWATQLIAANIDTAFIVTSCNQDFNIARLERYLALTYQAAAMPVIILTKTDLCDDTTPYESLLKDNLPTTMVVMLDARDDIVRSTLDAWCKSGQTVAFLGSSGVGKSTLINSLSDTLTVATGPIREDDAKGRHTTTRRELYLVPGGCMVLDTPGMRELQLSGVAEGLQDVFDDIAELSTRCRFNNCQHLSEPGCAILEAVEAGKIDSSRFQRWRKLATEDAHNTATLFEKKSKSRSLSKKIRNSQKRGRK